MLSRRFLMLAVATFIYFTGVTALFPVLPSYLTDNGAGKAEVGLVIGVFGVTALALRPTVGRLVDLKGRRPMMLGGAASFAVVVLLHALSASVPYLVVLRLMAGAIEAAFFVAATTGAADLAPDERQGEALSLFSVAIYLGGAAGPAMGEWLYHAGGGTLAFIGCAICGVLACLVVGFGVGEPAPEGQIGTTAPRLRGRGSGLARLGLVPTAVVPGAAVMLVIFGQGTFNTFVPLHADEIGLGSASFAYILFGVVVVGIRIVGRSWPDRMNPAIASAAAIAFAALGVAIVGLSTSLPMLLLGTAIMSGGQALAFPVLTVAAVRRSGSRDRGAVLGTVTAMVDAGFTFAPIIAGAVASAFDLRTAFLVAAVLMALGLPLTARLRENPMPESTPLGRP